MSQDKIVFEKWFESKKNPPLKQVYQSLSQDAAWYGWQAATAEANKRMAELEREGWVSDKERMDYLSNGGWEVLQDPKYWTDGLNVRQVIDRNRATPTDTE